jgi:hypothetical protein
MDRQAEQRDVPSRRASLASRGTRTLATLAGFVGIFYSVGGLLLWLRFRHLGLPAVEAVSAVDPAALVATALVQMVGPAVVVFGVFAGSALAGWL